MWSWGSHHKSDAGDWAVIAAAVWCCCFLLRGLDMNIKGRVCICNTWYRSLQMVLLLGGSTVLPMGHEDGQEGGVHSARGHRTGICPWLLVILKCPGGWGAAPRALRGLSCPKTWLCPQAEWLCQGQHIPPGACWLLFSWTPALRSNLSPNERQAVVFLGHCLLSLLFSLPCSSLCTFSCPCPSPLISKEQELGFGLNMNIKSQGSGLWNPTYIKADAAGVWQCSVVPLVISSQQTAVKNLSQLESFMCLSFTFWIFCCDWSYCNFFLFQSSVGWNLCNSTPKEHDDREHLFCISMVAHPVQWYMFLRKEA